MLCISAILRYLIARHGHRAGFHGWDDIAVSVAGQRAAGFIAIHHLLWRNCLELSEEALVVLGTIALIMLGLWFFIHTNSLHDIVLQHAPEITPDHDLGEGFSVTNLGIGYKLSYVLTALSLISAIVSLLPFKFNETIERAVDDKFEDGRRHVRQEFNRLESNLHKPLRSKPSATNQVPPSTDDQPKEPIEDKEDPSRFMPK